MKLETFRTIKLLYLCVCMLPSTVVCLYGQTTAKAYSPPLGGIELSAGAFRETPIGIPLHRTAVIIADFVEVAAPLVDDEGNFVSLRLFLDRSIGAAGEYDPDPNTGLPSHYLEVVTGSASGERFPIAGSGDDWVIIEQEPQGTLAAGFDPNEVRDRVRIRPCWTPDTLMPATEASISAESAVSADPIEMRDKDALLLPGRESDTQHVLRRFNDSANQSYYWAEWSGDNGYLIADDYGLMPGKIGWIRRAYATDVKWTVTGDVTTFGATWAIPLPASDGVLEWPFSLTEPETVTLDSSGLKSILRPSASAAERVDELVIWDELTGFYSQPSKRFYLQTASPEPIWREVGDNTTDQGTFKLEPGKAYTLRRRGE